MKFCNTTIDVATNGRLNKGAVDLFCDLNPDWVRNEIQIEQLEGGTTNTIVLGWCKDDQEKILIRFVSINCMTFAFNDSLISINVTCRDL